MSTTHRICLATACTWLFTMLPVCAQTSVDTRAIADEKQSANWLSVGRTYSENHYSPLRSINDRNVKQLGLAWYLDLPNQGSLQATPLAVNGVLFFSGMTGRVYAADGRSGRLLWEFDPDVAHHGMDERSVVLNVNRGVAFWRGKVYVGTVDGRLVALDGKTGHVVWSVQTFDESDKLKTISGAPRVFNGKVIIGHGGESGTRGYVTTYDAETGRKLWRFYTVPGDPAKGFENEAMAMAAQTWHGQWWQQGGNATVWDSITYDTDFNRVYIATANGTPINANERGSGGGDNLFVASIVALDADSGRYVWHYQVNPGEMWEYDATEQMTLAELVISGKSRKVLMQAPKNGFFYVIDRADGHLISAQKLGKATWAERIDLESGRPVEQPGIRYKDDPIVIWPSVFGIHNWQAMSFDSATGLMYIPTMNLGMAIGANTFDVSPKDIGDGTAALLAWDPVGQRKRWEVPLGDSFWNGGTLATAGNLVFQGTGSGKLNGYNATSGEHLWSFYAGLGINAAPITYAINGVQYVAILVGYGGGINAARVHDYGWRYGEQPRRLLAFALGKSRPLPPGKPPRFTVNAIDNPSLVIDAKLAAEGEKLYRTFTCDFCHGTNMRNIASFARDLRESALASTPEGFKYVVQDGALVALGMPKFEDLNEQNMRALYMYVRQQAREAVQQASEHDEIKH
jgi:quinohemoprotein ethanol dehydrogenase